MDKIGDIPRECSCGCRDIREDYGVWYCFSCGHRFYLEKEITMDKIVNKVWEGCTVEQKLIWNKNKLNGLVEEYNALRKEYEDYVKVSSFIVKCIKKRLDRMDKIKLETKEKGYSYEEFTNLHRIEDKLDELVEGYNENRELIKQITDNMSLIMKRLSRLNK